MSQISVYMMAHTPKKKNTHLSVYDGSSQCAIYTVRIPFICCSIGKSSIWSTFYLCHLFVNEYIYISQVLDQYSSSFGGHSIHSSLSALQCKSCALLLRCLNKPPNPLCAPETPVLHLASSEGLCPPPSAVAAVRMAI